MKLTMLFFVTVILFLLHFLPVTAFHPSISFVLSFNPPHRHLLSSSRYPPSLAVNLLRGLNSISNSLHTALGRQPFVFFVPETFVFWYTGVRTALVELLAMGALVLLLFLLFALRLFLVFWFAIFPVALGFATFGVGA